jgi:hypothetical protein
MPDFTVRSDSVDVEQIMEQIRARIREKRGVDYNEEQLRELAAVKLERFLDPRGVRSDLLERYRQVQADREPPALPNYIFEEDTLYQTHRAPIRWIRRLLQPILKLFFNPNAMIRALNIQSRLNTLYANREAARHGFDQLHFELMHNLVVETTRIGIEVKNLKMQVESLSSRLEFNERRARALESAVVYASETESDASTNAPPPRRPSSGVLVGPAESAPTANQSTAGGLPEGPGQRSRRRRRRRGRRGSGSAVATMGGPPTGSNQTPPRDPLQTSDAGASPPPDTTHGALAEPEFGPRPSNHDSSEARFEALEPTNKPADADPRPAEPRRDAGSTPAPGHAIDSGRGGPESDQQ